MFQLGDIALANHAAISGATNAIITAGVRNGVKFSFQTFARGFIINGGKLLKHGAAFTLGAAKSFASDALLDAPGLRQDLGIWNQLGWENMPNQLLQVSLQVMD